MQLAVRFRMLHSAPAFDAQKPRNLRIPSVCAFHDGLVSTLLTSFDVSDNEIGKEGAKFFADVLPR